MRRNEACALLTRIATDELIDKFVCKEILKSRDIVICEPHKVLDVLASDDTRKMFKRQLIDYIRFMSGNSMIDWQIRKDLNMLERDMERGFKDKCEEPYLIERCKNCPNYGGEK